MLLKHNNVYYLKNLQFVQSKLFVYKQKFNNVKGGKYIIVLSNQ